MLRALFLVALVACGGGAAVKPEGDPPLPGVIAPDLALATSLHEALVAKGPAYQPHTRNLRPDRSPMYTNRLIRETSPYLLQHAHNPMSWYAWGDDAFARAKREHKLVLVSVGYSTCHWCHVMEDDSFEDAEVAAYVNATYICIKVDREERPDVDAVYMDAVVAMTGDGGWPMTLVVDADRRPVFGATFLRKQQLLETLRQIRAVADSDPQKLADTAAKVASALADRTPVHGGGVVTADVVERGVRALAGRFDREHGGFGAKMKFPSAPDLELLLRYHRRTDDPRALDMVTATLAAMARGGIHDQLGGGFHRYATDRAWLVPHFEKMLYDNAQLAIVYLEASQLAGDPALAEIARTTLAYLARDMQAPDGGFAGASDADSPADNGERAEGRFFTWTQGDFAAVLAPDDAVSAGAYFSVGDPAAQVDNRTVLHLGAAPAPANLEAIRATLLATRAKRAPPSRDDKVIASWNGLAISAFARVGFALGDPALIAIAERTATFVLARLRDGDGLARSWRAGRASGVATLTDYVSVVQGLLDLFAADGDVRWLAAARTLADQLDRRFGDPAGGYFMTDAASEQLIVRSHPLDDNAEPSAAALAALDLLRLGELTGDDTWRARAEKLFGAAAGSLARGGGAAALRGAVESYLDQPLEIVIVGPSPDALVAVVRRIYLPNSTLVVTTDAALPALAKAVPFLDGKHALSGVATAFVCESTKCREPTSDPAVLARQLARVTPLFPDRSPLPL